MPTGERQAPEIEAPELLAVPIGEEVGADQGEGEGEREATDPSVIPRELFRHGLATAFGVAGALAGLDTLRQAPRRPEYDPAADSLYDLALETTWLRWLIEPQSLFMQRALVIGVFAVPVAAGCAQELRARRAKPVESSPDPEPEPEAPDDQAPE